MPRLAYLEGKAWANHLEAVRATANGIYLWMQLTDWKHK